MWPQPGLTGHPLRLRPLQGRPSNPSSMGRPARDSPRRETIDRSAESGMHAFISPQPEMTGITHPPVAHNQYGFKRPHPQVALALISSPLESPRRLRLPVSYLSKPKGRKIELSQATTQASPVGHLMRRSAPRRATKQPLGCFQHPSEVRGGDARPRDVGSSVSARVNHARVHPFQFAEWAEPNQVPTPACLFDLPPET